MTALEHRVSGWVGTSQAGVLTVPAARQPGRHRSMHRATLTLRRLFYVARHRRF